MFNPKKVLGWRMRLVVMAVVTLGAIARARGRAAAVGRRRLAERGLGPACSTGRCPPSRVNGLGAPVPGRLVSLVLRVSDGAVVGDATLDGVVADDTNGPRPLVTPTVTGRTMAFAVQPTPCAKSLARGVVTFVSRGVRTARSARRIHAHVGAPVEGQLS